MSLVKQHFYGFYNLVNIYSYFIRMVELKYWGNNLDGFQSHVAHTRRPGRAWRDARFPFFFFFAVVVLYLSLTFPLWPQLAQFLRASPISEKEWGVFSKTINKVGGRDNSELVGNRDMQIPLVFSSVDLLALLRFRNRGARFWS